MSFEIVDDRMWMPIHTKPRCEKKFLRFCERFNITAYLPLRKNVRTKRKSTLIYTYVPMFPGYSFACLNDEEKSLIVTSNTIVNFVSLTRDQEKSLVEDLTGIKILEQMQESENILVSPEIIPGSEVSIKSGPLRGLTGLVEQRKGVHRIIVNVEMICQSVCMELDSSDVEVVY